MRHSFFVLFLALMAYTGMHAQVPYHPFIEDGKVWKVAHYRNELLPDYWTENYYFEGDTIIADIHCVKNDAR